MPFQSRFGPTSSKPLKKYHLVGWDANKLTNDQIRELLKHKLKDLSPKQMERFLHRTFKARSPNQAALKAATRGFSEILLKESKKDYVHHYIGSTRHLNAKEITEFTIAKKIVKKPVVKKKETYVIVDSNIPRSKIRKSESARKKQADKRKSQADVMALADVVAMAVEAAAPAAVQVQAQAEAPVAAVQQVEAAVGVGA